MRCDKTEDRLVLLHDGSLDIGTAREIRRHLAECPECAKKYADIARAVDLGRSALLGRNIAVGPGYLEGVRAKIRRQSEFRPVFRWAVPAAAAVFLALSVGTYSLITTNGRMFSGLNDKVSTIGRSVEISTPSSADDETALVNAMYHYADVTLDDIEHRMDDQEIAAVLDSGER